MAAFVEDYAKTHPVAKDYGKTWAPLLPKTAYLYGEAAFGAVPPAGYGAAFPHPLRGNADSKGPDAAFYSQWATSPYAQTYLAEMAEDAVDKLGLGKRAGTDYLGVSFSSLDYVAHHFGPRSWEVQDELARLDRDLAGFFAHLDSAVGRGNYVVALSADHGGSPIPEDWRRTGVDAGWLNVEEVKQRIETGAGGGQLRKTHSGTAGRKRRLFQPWDIRQIEDRSGFDARGDRGDQERSGRGSSLSRGGTG